MDPPITVSGGYKMVMIPGDNQICRVLTAGLPWEEFTTKLVRESLHEGDVFVDCGANIGWFSVMASKLVGPSGKVYAFEPWKGNYEVLLENLRLNGCDNVFPEMVPLWSSNTLLKVYAPPDNNSGDSRVALQEGVIQVTEGEGFYVSSSKTLDKLFQPDSVQFVKIDCQGADADILMGGKRLFTESKKIRFVVEEPKGIPESVFGIPLVRQLEDWNFYYEKAGKQ